MPPRRDRLELNDEKNELDPESFKKSLKKLRETDAEFYNFLKENDAKLLEFNVDSDASDYNDESENEEKESIHKPSGELHGDSDESDFEVEAQSESKLTLKTINTWRELLESNDKIKIQTISNIINAFHAALLRISEPNEKKAAEFKVEGTGVFNSVIQLCVLYLKPALQKFLSMQQNDKNPQKCKKWIKVKGLLKMYFVDLLKLLGNVTSINILNILLKHLHQMTVFLGCFPNLAKVVFKRLTYLWSTSEDTIRVLAFLCILRVTRNNQILLLDNVLKTMYISYVKNSKFVSPNTRPGISFMRKSLIEMFSLDVNVSYQHVFLYIRQLAINLRNAIIVHKKENIQAVYNWQFINSIQLWAELFGATKNKPQLQPLIYPLVMIITNTIKLIPTAQYYPLRFHGLQILINLSRDCEIFIPILPFLLEILTSYDFSKKHKKISMKPMNFSCVLRLSKSHLAENGFKDAIIENIYILLLETLSLYSHTISFPDIVIICVIQLKKFLKSCTIANYSRKIRLVLEKIEENSKFIENKRKNVSFHLSDSKAIKAWETNILNQGTPIQTYYDTWRKMNLQQDKRRETKNHELANKLPTIEKKQKREKAPKDGPLELFPSESEDSDSNLKIEESEPPVKKSKLNKKKKLLKKSVKKTTTHDNPELCNENENDEINDFNLKDW